MKRLKFIIKNFCFFLMGLFPIRKNQILFFSYYGSNYGCSPKYLSEYLTQNYSNRFKIIWAFTTPKEFDNHNGKIVKYGSIKFIRYFRTSKFICTNFNLSTNLKKRKGQIYIQTWHNSTRLKKTHKDVINGLSKNFIEMAKQDASQIDYICCGSKFMHDIIQKSFWYKGKILDYGLPRNDILINKEEKQILHLKRKLNIPLDLKILLYAPTFRKNHNRDIYNLDLQRVMECLKNITGKEWLAIFRYHPHLFNYEFDNNEKPEIWDMTKYSDITELLLVSDLLITDYSSIIFDFALTNKPIFLYTPDEDQYLLNDFGLYFDLNKLPFPISKTNDEIIKKIQEFNKNQYIQNLKHFLNKIGCFESGRACYNLSEILLHHLDNN